MTDEPVLLEVGHVGRAHGLRGEVHVVAVTNLPERFAPGSRLVVGDVPLVVESARTAGNGWVVHFADVNDRNAAELLRGRSVKASALDAAPDGAVFVHEVIGAEVRDRAGNRIGRVEAVQANPAHDLLVLDNGALVPMVFVVDQQPGMLVVDLPDGLLDL
ncbi:MAG: ribosome maturation factor RimM [Acidimicrobiia bacterium]